ncbi:hypothetical protein PUN71_015445 [Arthrobacter sp. NQ7]|uniref:hypothetical protein n=1 Tax=Arthrobacter sp. NQ7 TaxID=3032303 RepID=UPI00240EB818|nr:hypothetical protein [Arthrobacter sp. NQ7]MDJ0458598.1 hypothetical protein [Arthrobacter sp. NQ7]
MYETTGLLSKDVKDPKTSIGHYLRSTFPNTKPLQAEYKALAGDLLIDSMGANAGTVGTAMDLIIRLILEPDETPMSALTLFPFNATYHQVVHELSALVGEAADREVAARAAWALALCVNAYRAGPAWAPLVPEMVQSGQFTADRMLGQADDAAVAELIALRELSQERLIPQLKGPFSLGPTFDLSEPGPAQRIAGEADLIAGGLLVDIKTTLAPRNKAGLRPDALKAENVYQLLGYVLLDYSNQYDIDQVGIYSARYGSLTVWPLNRVTSLLSGRDFDINVGRHEVWGMMQQDPA